MIRVYVPYTDLNPWVKLTLNSYDIDVRYIELSGHFNYRALMSEIWRIEGKCIIVEQDVLPYPMALEYLWGCPCKWGTYSYRYQGGVGISHMLGCAKITPELIEATPGIWDADIPWNLLDQHLFRVAHAKGIEPHCHQPAVNHLNAKQLGMK